MENAILCLESLPTNEECESDMLLFDITENHKNILGIKIQSQLFTGTAIFTEITNQLNLN